MGKRSCRTIKSRNINSRNINSRDINSRNIKNKRGVALGYVLAATLVLFTFALAVLPAAEGMIGFSRSTIDHSVSYIDSRSAIEYAKAVLAARKAAGQEITSFYITGVPLAGGELEFQVNDGDLPQEAENVLAVCEYDAETNGINISSDAQRLGAFGSPLSYNSKFLPAEVSDADAPEGYIQVGAGRYGASLIMNSGPSFGGGQSGNYFDIPLLLNTTVRLSGTGHVQRAKAMYFIGSPAIEAQNGQVDLYSNVLYFRGQINGNYGDYNNSSKIFVNRYDTSRPGYIYFDNVTLYLKKGAGETRVLNGLYSYTERFNLFDFGTLDAHLTRVGNAGPDPAYGFEPYITGATPEKIETLTTAESPLRWVGEGRLENGRPSAAPGKVVFMYIEQANNFQNYMPATYSAEQIILQSVSGPWYVGNQNRQGAAFTLNASYISLDFKNSVYRTYGSKFIVTSPDGGPVVLRIVQPVFLNGILYNQGKYSCPAGTDLFAPEAVSKLTPVESGGGAGGGDSGAGGFEGGVYYR